MTTTGTPTTTAKKTHPALLRFVQQDPEVVKALQAEVRQLAKDAAVLAKARALAAAFQPILPPPPPNP